MIIENITIYDYIDNRINKFTFSSGVNLFVSKSSTIGKSSLMKSIYFTLGYNIKIWPSEWNVKNMVFHMNIVIDSKKYSITRHKDLFYINGKENTLSEQEYSLWLQNKLNLEIKIKEKHSKKLVDVYASEVLLPFYIDQDKSWNGYLYAKTSDSYGRYSDTVKNVLNFFFEITNKKLLDLEVEKSIVEKKVKIVEKKEEALTLLEEDYLSKNIKDSQVYISKVEKIDDVISENQLNNYLQKINVINASLATLDQEIIEYEKKINIVKRDLAELEKLKKSYSKRFQDIKHKCIYCNSNLTDEQSLTRLKIRNNLYEITEQTDEFNIELKSLKLEREKKISIKNNFVSEQVIYEDFVNNNREVNTLIENTVRQEVFNNYVSLERELKTDRISALDEIDGIRKSINVEKKVGTQKRTDIKKKYNELNSQYELSLSKVKLSDIDFYNFKEVSGSGNDSNKKMLALYTLYSNLINQFSTVKVPFGMDSFIKNETAVDFKEEMFGFLSKYYLTIPNQMFFSIIEENLVYIDTKIDYKKIELKRPILEIVTEKNKYLKESFNFIH